MSGPTEKQRVLELYESGDVGEVEFFELALAAGFTLEEINKTLLDKRIEMEWED